MDVSEMLSEFADHGHSDNPTRYVSILNDVVNDVNSRLPWKFLEGETTLSLVAGNDTPTLPSDFGKVIALSIESLGTVLMPERYDAVAKTYRGQRTAQGQPFLYYFVGSALRVYFVPDANYTATLGYYRLQAELNSSSVESAILLPPRHHRVLVLGTLSKLYAMEDDPDLAASFDAQFEKRIATMTEDLELKQTQMPDRIVDVYQDGDDMYYA